MSGRNLSMDTVLAGLGRGCKEGDIIGTREGQRIGSMEDG